MSLHGVTRTDLVNGCAAGDTQRALPGYNKPRKLSAAVVKAKAGALLGRDMQAYDIKLRAPVTDRATQAALADAILEKEFPAVVTGRRSGITGYPVDTTFEKISKTRLNAKLSKGTFSYDPTGKEAAKAVNLLIADGNAADANLYTVGARFSVQVGSAPPLFAGSAGYFVASFPKAGNSMRLTWVTTTTQS